MEAVWSVHFNERVELLVCRLVVRRFHLGIDLCRRWDVETLWSTNDVGGKGGSRDFFGGGLFVKAFLVS